jgi:Type II CAAX prenyl endopeptidase Rce1-like
MRILRLGLPGTGQVGSGREGVDLEGTGAGPPPGRGLVYAFLGLLVFTGILMALSFPLGLYAGFSGTLSTTYGQFSLATPYLWVGPIPLHSPISLTVGEALVFYSSIYAAMFLYASGQSARLRPAFSAAARLGIENIFSSPLAVVIVSTGFLAFSATIVDSLVTASGSTIGNPFQSDPLGVLVGFTFAPIAEEFGFRVMLVGLVALILSLGKPARVALRSLWRPSAAYEGLAVGSGTFLIIWAATGFSAVTFGACHVLCGGGWDFGKFWEATYGGVVLGVLYVKYGFHVAVLTHWGIDYFGSAFAFFGQAAFKVPWNSSNTEFIGQFVVDIDLLYLFGLASFLVVLYVGLKRLSAWRARGEPPPVVSS